jgi:prepilin-type N-terminal cleavage/methylation domain-containing protein/prepilin-type processing-associated H-X9-DG protein
MSPFNEGRITASPQMHPCLKSARRSRSAFTLVEVTVVIAIIAVLTAIAFVLFRRGREAADKTQCLNNLRQIHGAMQSFAVDHDGKLPPPFLAPEDILTGDGLDTGGVDDDVKTISFFEVLDRYIATTKDGKASSVWVCPADTRQWEPGAVRCSYAMNPKPLPDFSYRASDGMVACTAFPFSPAPIQPQSRVVFLGETGGAPVAEPVIMYSAENQLPLNIRLRHETRDRSPDEPYSSVAQMKQAGGKANFLFFDGHAETLGYEQAREAIWTSQP